MKIIVYNNDEGVLSRIAVSPSFVGRELNKIVAAMPEIIALNAAQNDLSGLFFEAGLKAKALADANTALDKATNEESEQSIIDAAQTAVDAAITANDLAGANVTASQAQLDSAQTAADAVAKTQAETDADTMNILQTLALAKVPNASTDPANFWIIDESELPIDQTFAAAWNYDGSAVVEDTAKKSEVLAVSIDGYISALEVGNDASVQAEPDQALIDALTLDEYKDLKKKQAKRRFKHSMNYILFDYVKEEIDTWDQQKIDTDYWLSLSSPTLADADNAALLKDIAKGRNNKDDSTITIAEIDSSAALIKTKSDIFRPFSGGLVGFKKKLMSDIDAAVDKAALDTVDTNDILGAAIAFLSQI